MVVANNAHARVPRIYQHPGVQQDNKARSRSQKPWTLKLQVVRRIMAGLLVIALALLVIYRYGQISQLNMEINRDNSTLNALTDEHRHLKISIAQLTALDRLEQLAMGELGMQYPHPDQFRFVGKNNPESGDGDGE